MVGNIPGKVQQSRFAQAAEPAHLAVTQQLARCEALRAAGQLNLSCANGLARQTNPFKRCDGPASADAAHAHGARGNDLIEVLAVWRERKNNNQ